MGIAVADLSREEQDYDGPDPAARHVTMSPARILIAIPSGHPATDKRP